MQQIDPAGAATATGSRRGIGFNRPPDPSVAFNAGVWGYASWLEMVNTNFVFLSVLPERQRLAVGVESQLVVLHGEPSARWPPPRRTLNRNTKFDSVVLSVCVFVWVACWPLGFRWSTPCGADGPPTAFHSCSL